MTGDTMRRADEDDFLPSTRKQIKKDGSIFGHFGAKNGSAKGASSEAFEIQRAVAGSKQSRKGSDENVHSNNNSSSGEISCTPLC